MIKLSKREKLKGCTLIIPAVAVGNVGQLAVDLFITNGKFEKIGHIISPCFIPIVGGNPYLEEDKQLCTSCDIYHDCDEQLIAIQIRSPVTKRVNKFFDIVKQFVEAHRIAKVIIVTSAWAHTRIDAQIQGDPMRYLASSAFISEFRQQISDSKFIELEKTPSIYGGPEEARIPGGGFASQLFKFLDQETGVPTAIILRFCSEGDNIPDAIAVLDYIFKLMALKISEMKMPNSWKFLFGDPAPKSLY